MSDMFNLKSKNHTGVNRLLLDYSSPLAPLKKNEPVVYLPPETR